MRRLVHTLGKFSAVSIALFGLLCAPAWSSDTGPVSCETTPEVCLDSLTELTTDNLRQRDYGSEIQLLKRVERIGSERTFLLSYQSDRLALFARLDIPALPAPAKGYPIVVLAPGWLPREQAVNWDFAVEGASTTATVIAGLVDEGFAVVTAGYRGRGKVDSLQAEGIEFRDAWGNGSYLSPIFYAIDTLNLLAGLKSLDQQSWEKWLPEQEPPRFDYSRVSLWGHSQGGDVALTALAVSGHNARFPQSIHAASIWSGNIADRFTQANTFGPMATTTEAFMSGDGSWNASAVGKNGELNAEFIFPYPADWIGTVDPTSKEWTWQAEQWSTATVFEAKKAKHEEMYSTLNRYVKDMGEISFSIARNEFGRTSIKHDPQLTPIMPMIGGYHFARHIEPPLLLHISDRDYYSFPIWNHQLADQIAARGGSARVHIYPGNTHSLQLSKHRWFTPAESRAGAPLALARDAKIFRTGKIPPSKQ